MKKPSKRTRPTGYQTLWLRRIAASPMMITREPGEPIRYSLQNGLTIPAPTAETLIKRGWVKAERDGLFDEPQTYRALTP